MNYLSLFAHSQQQHTETTSSFYHNITQWPVAISIYLIGTGLLIWLLVSKFHIKPPVAIIVFMAISFVLGITAYSVVPALSVLAITLGIATALLFTLLSIG